MTAPPKKILLLALGNDFLGDDGVALTVARALKSRYQDRVDFVETAEAGLALLEWLEGYERALIVDSIQTGNAPPGTIRHLSPDDFGRCCAPSAHYAGLPDVMDLANRLGVEIPSQIHILAIEIEPPRRIAEGLSPIIEGALPQMIQRAGALLESIIGIQN